VSFLPIVFATQLLSLGKSIFEAVGASEEEAKLVSKLLVEANLTGHDSHGVIRILNYVRGVNMGAVKPKAKISVVRETPSTALLDGGWGFGQVVAVKAMEIAIEKALKHNISAVGVTHIRKWL
jgi:LDH2 family malate/lactate/ureidoglycolate dehydrogenase